jgi:tRNA/rRNA methyltransferase
VQPNLQERVVVVLVRARNPANIGAVARAMHDLGYSDLRVVNEYPVPFAAAKSAVDAAEVLARAGEFTALPEAIADCTLVVGTTAVGERRPEHPLYTLNQAAPLVAGALRSDPAARIALLFGSEKTGLSNEELSHCHWLMTIPMNQRGAARHLSMNLGQAAAVCLYTLAQNTPTQSDAAPTEANAAEAAAPAAALERMTAMLGEVLERSGYTRRHPANARPANVRRLVWRMALAASDAPVWTGILRQLLHALKDGRPAPPPTPGIASSEAEIDL